MNLTVYPSKIKNKQCVNISGHKHSFVQIISAAIILNQKCRIKNVPATDDTNVFIQLIQQLGGTATFRNNQFDFDPTNMCLRRPSIRLCKQIHGALYFLFALAIRFGRFYQVPTGGCQIGKHGTRPDLHLLKILVKFGKVTKIKENEYSFTPNMSKDVKQNIMSFSDSIWFLSGEQISSATKLCILAALGNKEAVTTIKNYYFRTDVADLLDFIKLCGGNVKQQKRTLTIIPPKHRIEKSLSYTLSDCQSEIITFIAFAVVNNIKIILDIKNPQRTQSVLAHELNALQKMGVDIKFIGNRIYVSQHNILKPLNLSIKHNGIQSDHQPFFALMLTQANAKSSITEHVWMNRFKYTDELNKLGFNIKRHKNKIIISPYVQTQRTLHSVTASDTRAAAVLLIAATTLLQQTTLHNAEHMMRGYDNLIGKIQRIGAKITI